MNEAQIETLAQQIATEELDMDVQYGEWVSDGSDDFWCPDYTEEQGEQVDRVAEHITKIFNNTDWKKVANNQNYEVGDKVKFLVEIERGMETIVPKDSTGTIANIDEAFVYISLHNEKCAKDLAEWDGQLYLSNTPVTDFDKHEYEGLDSIEKVDSQ